MTSRTTGRAALGLVALVGALVVVPARAASAGVLDLALATTRPVVTYGGDAVLSVHVTTTAGAPAAGTGVYLRATAADGSTYYADAGTTDTAGDVALIDSAVTAGATYTALTSDQSESAPVAVSVAFAVTARTSSRLPRPTLVSPVALPPGGQVRLQGAIAPAGSATPLTVEQRRGSGPWTSLGTVPVAPDGTFALPLGRRSRVGTWTVRVTHPAEHGLVAGVAEGTTRVTVTGAGPRTAWRPIAGTRARPARWGTCRIDYRVNPRRMPATGLADLREAMRRVTQVSGIAFRYRGRTTVTPRGSYRGPGRNRIVVAWAPPARSGGLLSDSVGGVGGTSRTRSRLLSGFVLMNSDYAAQADAGFAEGQPVGLVLMHELGHVVGLDHAPDDRQVMAAGAPLPAAVWGAGDRTGLRRVGARCR
jgi:hypothetical protein